jgi:hypothetical protein
LLPRISRAAAVVMSFMQDEGIKLRSLFWSKMISDVFVLIAKIPMIA